MISGKDIDSISMKLSMMSYTIARQKQHFNLTRMLDLTVELKLDGIDFVTLHGEKAGILRKMADDRGVPVVCHTFVADLNHVEKAKRAPAVDASKRSIDDAVALGAPVVMIPTPGIVGIDRAASRANWIAGLQEVSRFAADAGVILTVENFAGPGASSPLVTAADLMEAVREVPGLKITYDNGNAVTGEDAAQSFRDCAQHVVHAHFKDWDVTNAPETGFEQKLDGRFYRSALIGEGVMDHAACLAAMREAGYDGYINIEYEGAKYDPYEATRRAAAYLRKI